MSAQGSSRQRIIKRFLRHPLAMFGMVIVCTMTLLCAFAPWVTAFNPEQQQVWLGITPPLTETLPVQAQMRFNVGEQPSLPHELEDASKLCFEIQPQRYRECRAALRDGQLHRLFWLEGAVPIEHIILKPENTFSRQRDGSLLPLQAPLVLERGSKHHSQGLNPQHPVAIYRVVESSSAVQTVKVTRDATGRVTAIDVDGEAVDVIRLSGHTVIKVSSEDQPITRFHLLGTDDLGRDLWSRILYGGRISLLVGFVATLVSLIIGLIVGSVSGYCGGRWDRIIMGGVDVLYAIPFMFLVILLLVLFGRSLVMLFVALGAVQWLTMSRIVRSQVMAIKQLPYIDAARLAGAPASSLMFKHILPNIAGPIVIYTTLTIPAVILEESFLSFIGLTVQFQGRSVDSWGSLVHLGMLSLGQEGQNSHLLFYPSIVMGLTLLGLNLMGDGLRDALDPRQQK